jgi:hypothetical protein
MGFAILATIAAVIVLLSIVASRRARTRRRGDHNEKIDLFRD